MDYIGQGLLQAFDLLLEGNSETYSAIWVTLQVSTLSICASLFSGVPLGFLLGNYSFRGKSALQLTVNTLYSFPTVVIGLIVYTLLSQKGPLAEFNLLFTLPGIAIGQTILGLPIVVGLTSAAVENADKRISLTLFTLGASKKQLLMSTVWEIRYSLLVAAAVAYGRIVSEVGISMMVGGNIKWYTRTITTAIALETSKGKFSMGIALGIVLLLIAFLINLAIHSLRTRTEK